jgi:putative RNA 2'-phosphotransferase
MHSDLRISKRLALWLRHKPELANLALDPAGRAEVSSVLTELKNADLQCSVERLQLIVEQNVKKRFELSPDNTRVRARQGHSIVVTLDWPLTIPPQYLYHGTIERCLPSITSQGLLPMGRHHVHLSPDIGTARTVGARRGAPVVLRSSF